MRLGLIGTGKQGQRYLQERNGGRHIVVSGSRSVPLDGVDGVIIATHPAGHKKLALEAIAAGKHVLIEKPLALNLRDCMAIIDFAEKREVKLLVAHTHLFSTPWLNKDDQPQDCRITYEKHERDYSPWIDWAPHGLALLADANEHEETDWLLASLCVEKHDAGVSIRAGDYFYAPNGSSGAFDWPTPMWNMVKSFVIDDNHSYEFQRRVYRALFAQENHGTT